MITVQRKVDGLIEPANFPPNDPPTRANTAITNAAIQFTLPENMKNIAAATFTLSEIVV